VVVELVDDVDEVVVEVVVAPPPPVASPPAPLVVAPTRGSKASQSWLHAETTTAAPSNTAHPVETRRA
jgi:hypothetical protein